MVGIHILGTAQDGGLPHLGCICSNCELAHKDPLFARMVACIAIIGKSKTILVDATPDIINQLYILRKHINLPIPIDLSIDGILITHLHMGHYIGLLQFGKEAAGTKNLPVYMTKETSEFISQNKPFSYLIDRKDIASKIIEIDRALVFDNDFSITPFHVPHRNEDGNTVGLQIRNLNTNQLCLYIPDIDYISNEIEKLVKQADIVLFDGTFYSKNELPRQENVPHPPMNITINKLGSQPEHKFYFTHINHTNPVLSNQSEEINILKKHNYQIASENSIINL